MSDLAETSTWINGIYQLERTDPVDAGTGGNGVSNLQASQLACRTKYLYDSIASILAGTVPMVNSPSQFDNSKDIATTEWVNSNSGRFVDCLPLSSTTNYNIQPADAGKLLYWRGATFQFGTMPNLAAIPAGVCFHFKVENALLTLTAQSGEVFFIQDVNGQFPIGNTGQQTIYLHKDDEVTIFRTENNTVLGAGTPYWGIIVKHGNFLDAGQIVINHSGIAPRALLYCDGSLMPRSSYPRLWAYAQAYSGTNLLSESAWQAGSATDKTKFSSGTITSGSNANFRMPLISDIANSHVGYFMKF